ncbi:hypothetical protein L7F22_036702 [Adiantum nelumboides]|nr:hypothetical protein [Adiantum nelumboides]
MELVPPACRHMQTHNYSHMIQLPHAHHHQRPLLPLPEPKTSIELVRKFGHKDAYNGLHAPALSNVKVIDLPTRFVCWSIAPVCVDKQLPAQAFENVMHVESLCCAAHILCSLPTLSQAHTDTDASNKRKQTVDSVAPVQIFQHSRDLHHHTPR